VMATFENPRPVNADVHETLTAAARVAESLRLRAHKVAKEAIEGNAERIVSKGRGVMDRIERAIEAFMAE
jgi:hypothetical protein